MQANQTPVILTVVIAAVILLVAGFVAVGSIQSSNEASASAVNAKLDTAVASVSNLKVPVAPAPTQAPLDPSLCDNIDGCGGMWDVPNQYRDDLADAVLDELTENNNRDLFDAIEDQVNVDDRDDIFDSDIYKTGDMRVNTDPEHLETDSKVTVEFMIEVSFYEDGSNSDTQTKYFIVTAELEDFDDGFNGADVTVKSVVQTSRRTLL